MSNPAAEALERLRQTERERAAILGQLLGIVDYLSGEGRMKYTDAEIVERVAARVAQAKAELEATS